MEPLEPVPWVESAYLAEFTRYLCIKQACYIGRPEDDWIIGSSAITLEQIIEREMDIWAIKCPKSHACPASGVDSNGGTDSTMESVPVPTPVISYKPDSDSNKKLEPPHP